MLGAFVPREHDYAKLVTERGGFYGADCPLEMFFEEAQIETTQV